MPQASDTPPTAPMSSALARRRLLPRNELRDEIETWVNEGGAGDDVS